VAAPDLPPGHGFAARATDPTVTVAELTVTRCQQHPWEVKALAELRSGHVARAVDACRAHGSQGPEADAMWKNHPSLDHPLTLDRNGMRHVQSIRQASRAGSADRP
jgi:hypothetical protein